MKKIGCGIGDFRDFGFGIFWVFIRQKDLNEVGGKREK